MASTKVLILKGSPRHAGNSAMLAGQVAAGAEAVGAQVQSIYLHGLDIRPCDACDGCHGALEDRCVVEDDMQDLYPLIRDAGAIVYASPIYWFTITAQLKAFMDRCYALGSDVTPVAEHGLAGKRIGVVLTYGGDDPFDSGAINAIRMFQDAFSYVPSEIVGMLYGCASGVGAVVENRGLMEKAYELGRKLGAGA
jgi:multimeric flavodoxin WrbA